jgi:hypothetical protein
MVKITAVETKPKVMKALHAAHLVDKNSRTIAKISQLLVFITHRFLLKSYQK